MENEIHKKVLKIQTTMTLNGTRPAPYQLIYNSLVAFEEQNYTYYDRFLKKHSPMRKGFIQLTCANDQYGYTKIQISIDDIIGVKDYAITAVYSDRDFDINVKETYIEINELIIKAKKKC